MPSSTRPVAPNTAPSSCTDEEAISKLSLRCCEISRRTNITQPWPPWTMPMQSLMPIEAYCAPAGWQVKIGLMVPIRSLALSWQNLVSQVSISQVSLDMVSLDMMVPINNAAR